MAIVQISRIQHRRGLQQDLPQLASGELGWSIDARKLYIGNGTAAEYSPAPGERTEILTEYSILDFTAGFAANLIAVESNVSILQSEVAALQMGTTTSNVLVIGPSSSGTVTSVTANNAVMTYTLTQGSNQRTGTLKLSRISTNGSYDDEYTETGTTDILFTVDASSGTYANVDYTTTTATNLMYRIQSLT